MSSLSTKDRMYLEKLFQMSSGYVLDFSNQTFGEFFATNLDLDIWDERFAYASGSKANTMRGFWSQADDVTVGRSILELIDYIESKILLGDFQANDFKEQLVSACKAIGERLIGTGPDSSVETNASLEAFLKADFEEIGAAIQDLESDIQGIIRQRLEEIQRTITTAPLASILLIGSTMEGVLLDVAKRESATFTQATAAPSRKDGTVIPLGEWKLNDLINVAFEAGYVSEDVKQFSHSVRGFRNYIHPRAQAKSRFNPTVDTAKICFQVLKAALTQVNTKLQSHNAAN